MTSSVMQVISLLVLGTMDVATVGMFGTILHNPLPLAAQTETQVTIAGAFWKTDMEDAQRFEEATANRVTLRDSDGTCISFEISEDAPSGDRVLTREFGSCDDDRFASAPVVLVGGLTADSEFRFTSIADRPIIDGQPVGECDPFFQSSECASAVPRIATLDARVRTGVRTTGLWVAQRTKAVSLDYVTDNADVAYNQSFLVTDEVEGETP